MCWFAAGDQCPMSKKAWIMPLHCIVMEQRRVTPHEASHTTRWGGSAEDARTTRHAGYAASLRIRPRATSCGWLEY